MKSLVILFGSRAVTSLAQAAAVLLLARWTVPAEYGLISSLLGVGLFLTAILDFGLGPFILRIRSIPSLAELLEPALLLNLLGAIALLVVLVPVGIVILPVPLAAVLIAIWIAGDKYVDTSLCVSIADDRMGSVGAVLVLRRVMGLAAFVGLYVLGVAPAVAFGAGQGIGLLLGLGYVLRTVVPHRPFDSWSGLRGLTKEGPWFYLGSLSTQASSLDSPIVAAVSGVAAAGYYSVGSRLSRPFVLLATAISAVLIPAAARGPDGMGQRVTRWVVLLAVGLSLVGLGLAPLMPLIIELTAGRAYVGGAPSATVLLVGMPFVALASPIGGVLQGRGQARWVAVNGVVFSVLLLVGIAVGAWIGGAIGAAYGLTGVAALKFATLAVRAWSV
ncbi:MAG: lipopolysaccharide biosynthesis protein [Curtobacterium sp.]